MQALIKERKTIDRKNKERLKEVSKKINQSIRDRKRTKRQEKIQKLLEEFKRIKTISNIKSARKKTLIPKIRDDSDEIITSRRGTANVFGNSTANSTPMS